MSSSGHDGDQLTIPHEYDLIHKCNPSKWQIDNLTVYHKFISTEFVNLDLHMVITKMWSRDPVLLNLKKKGKKE